MQKIAEHEQHRLETIRTFYDTVYYQNRRRNISIPSHLRRLTVRLGIRQGEKVLDVACGLGEWLSACQQRDAVPYGIDLSDKAIAACRAALPDGYFYQQPAERLPFETASFDIVSCLGALEHFVHPQAALQEIRRVAKADARIILLVPNADFLAYRLKLFSGTDQADIKEDVRSLQQWQVLFQEAGLDIIQRWRDLHLCSWAWLAYRGWLRLPVRLVEASVIAILPLRWQYQVYHLCRKTSA